MRIHVIHPVRIAGLGLLVGLSFGLQGCGPKEVPPPASTAPAAPPAEPKPGAAPGVLAPVPAPAIKAAPAAVAAAPAAPGPAAGAATSAPASEVKPVASVQVPAPVVGPVSDPGGEVAVKPAKAGLSRVGTASCKMCHKLQFTSWSETAHARRNPPLDCESCHGAGSEYKAMATMKDPAKASAAGLVRPTAAFCATCHKRGWSEGMLKKAHAHKS